MPKSTGKKQVAVDTSLNKDNDDVNITDIDIDSIKCTSKEEYESLFRKYNDHFLDLSEQMKRTNEQRDKVIDIMRRIQETFKSALKSTNADNNDTESDSDTSDDNITVSDDDSSDEEVEEPISKKKAPVKSSKTVAKKVTKNEKKTEKKPVAKKVETDSKAKKSVQIANDSDEDGSLDNLSEEEVKPKQAAKSTKSAKTTAVKTVKTKEPVTSSKSAKKSTKKD